MRSLSSKLANRVFNLSEVGKPVEPAVIDLNLPSHYIKSISEQVKRPYIVGPVKISGLNKNWTEDEAAKVRG